MSDDAWDDLRDVIENRDERAVALIVRLVPDIDDQSAVISALGLDGIPIRVVHHGMQVAVRRRQVNSDTDEER